jgi:hypothetical protein
VAEDDSDEPDAAERAGTRRGTEPLWRPTGADLVQVRVARTAPGLRLVSVLDGTAKRLAGAVAHAGTGTALLGDVRSRADWGADESIRTHRPTYASRVDAVVVHHTVQGNDYAPGDVPALIRADYAYHVKARGWGDLGYNLLVDRFGRIWEGRAGGLGRATIGAHAQGFNTRTLGVAVIGDMTKGTPPVAALHALSRVAAYAGATWRFDPRSSVVLTSGGSPRYASGRRVTLHRVFGHLETGQTACPGKLEGDLPQIRTGAAVLLGPAPVVHAVQVSGAPVHAPTPLDVRGRLSRTAPWSASLRDSSGAVVARATGTSATPDLQWNGLVAPNGVATAALLPARPGTYTWTVRVDDGYHRAASRSGTVSVGLPVAPIG